MLDDDNNNCGVWSKLKQIVSSMGLNKLSKKRRIKLDNHDFK